jgi:antitoxin (DNA-binding transcriptional repressor) of toxin-antitoxin stability system
MTMAQFNIAEAKAHFSEVIVAKDNRPIAKLVPLRPAKRSPGTGKGQILFRSPDFDAPLEDFAEYR